MDRKGVKRGLAACAALVLLCLFPLVVSAAEQDTIGGSSDEQEEAGGQAGAAEDENAWRKTLPEQFWYLDPEVRDAVARDPKVVPMYEAAVKAKHDRRTAGTVLYFVGAPLVAAGFVLIVAPDDLGFDNEETDPIAISLASAGAGTIVTAALLRGLELPAEKRFKQYMKDRYDVLPVVSLPRVRTDGMIAWNVIEFAF